MAMLLTLYIFLISASLYPMDALQKSTPLLTHKELLNLIFETPSTQFARLKGHTKGINVGKHIYSMVQLSAFEEALILLRGTSGKNNKSNSDLIKKYTGHDYKLFSFMTRYLTRAAYRNNLRACALLLCAGGNLTAPLSYKRITGSALLHAARGNCLETAQFLLEAGADPNLYGVENNCALTPLYQAARLGHTQMAKLLIAAGADQGNNFDERVFVTPLEIAVTNRNEELVTLLVDHLKNSINEQNHYGVTMLSRVVGHHNTRLTHLFLKARACPNIPDDDGNTALHFADYEEAILLLRYGALIIENKQGATPLHFTTDPSMVDLLLEKDPLLLNKSTASGETALCRAVKLNRLEVIIKLLEHGADFTQNIRGQTPLYIATDRRQTEIVRLLLNAATPREVNLFTDSDETSLDRAVSHGDSEIVRLLLKKGALPSMNALHLALKKKTLTLFDLSRPNSDSSQKMLQDLYHYLRIIRLLEQALFSDEAP